MTITWKTVSAPNLPEGNPVQAAALFSRTMQNFNDRMKERGEDQKTSAAQQAYYDLINDRGDPNEIMQKAAKGGYLNQIYDIQKNDIGVQKSQFDLNAAPIKLGHAEATHQRAEELQPYKLEGKELDLTRKEQNIVKAQQDAINAEREKQLVASSNKLDAALLEVPPELREDLIKEVNKKDPAIFFGTEYFKNLSEKEKAAAKGRGAFEAKINPFGGPSSMSGGGNNQTGMTREQEANFRKFVGPTTVTTDPKTGKPITVPQDVFAKGFLPKNNAEAMRKMVVDPRISKAMGWDAKTTKWWSNFRPWSWGDEEKSKFWEDLKELPNDDQDIVKGMMALYNAQDPDMANDWFINVANQASLRGKLDKKELLKQLDTKVNGLYQNRYATGRLQ
jgi:hypothetical protein